MLLASVGANLVQGQATAPSNAYTTTRRVKTLRCVQNAAVTGSDQSPTLLHLLERSPTKTK